MYKLPAALTTKTLLTTGALAAMLVSTGCVTRTLFEQKTQTVKHVLSEDQIVAFGRPAQPLPKMPNANMVIVGEKNSYVLNRGGSEMMNLLTHLNPKHLHVDNDMSFDVSSGDGYFKGEMKLSYAKLKDEFDRSDYRFFLQNEARECTSPSDARINAQRFCFAVPVQGGIYPPVSNLSAIQSKYRTLSKPYTVSFYSNNETLRDAKTTPNRAQKLVLLPFALAFDAVTLPLQLLESLD